MLRGLFQPAPEERSASNSVWGVWPGDSSGSAPVVSGTSALQLLAVSGCVRLITDSISTLPIDVYREDKQGVKTEINKPAWLKSPMTDLDFVGWCTQTLTSLLLHGNAYSAITRNGTSIVEMIPVDPTLVHVSRVRGRKVFLVNGREYPGELLHIPGMMLPGTDAGLSPLDYARQSIGLGLQAQEYASDQFATGVNMPGVIESPGRLQPEQMTAMAQAWRKARSKRGRGMPGVLEGGATWKPTGISNEAAQFLQARQWTAAEIAAQVYMVDPSDLGIPVGGTTLTYANLEQRNLRRVQVTFLPWLVRVEKALSGLLPSPQYVKFNVDGLLRGDTATRWQTYATASNINAQAASYGQPPVLLTSEMREFEDLNVIEEYPNATLPVPAEPVQQNSAPQVYVVRNEAAPAPVTNVRLELPEAVEASITPQINELAESVDRLAARQAQPAEIAQAVASAVVRSLPEPVEPEPPKPMQKIIHRDADGRIERVVETPIEES